MGRSSYSSSSSSTTDTQHGLKHVCVAYSPENQGTTNPEYCRTQQDLPDERGLDSRCRVRENKVRFQQEFKSSLAERSSKDESLASNF